MKCLVTILCSLLIVCLPAIGQVSYVVDADGGKGFNTIQGAIQAAQVHGDVPVTILIMPGIYREKLYIEKHNLTLQGFHRDSVRIEAAIARDEWRCMIKDDWGVATMNVKGNDLTLKNLTLSNNYALVQQQSRTISCFTDTGLVSKTISTNSHQMALRAMHCTRLAAINCRFISYGGDTVSPWEVYQGQWYFRDCVMEGGVDLYCPRGWAYAENCDFIAHSGSAILWHDGSQQQDQKTVLKHCRFSGYDGFSLGRFHRDAQFWLVDCEFAPNMQNKPIYRVPTNNNLQWKDRIYYHNCHSKGGTDFSWHANNLPDNVKASAISAAWVFGDSWQPQNIN